MFEERMIDSIRGKAFYAFASAMGTNVILARRRRIERLTHGSIRAG
jgi:hypothetical protein